MRFSIPCDPARCSAHSHEQCYWDEMGGDENGLPLPEMYPLPCSQTIREFQSLSCFCRDQWHAPADMDATVSNSKT